MEPIGFGHPVGHVVAGVAVAVGTGAGVVGAVHLVRQLGCLVPRMGTRRGRQLCGG